MATSTSEVLENRSVRIEPKKIIKEFGGRAPSRALPMSSM